MKKKHIKEKVYVSKYSAGPGAIPYLVGKPKSGLTKVIRDNWAYFYKDNKEVWSCNSEFASFNFYRERE